MAEQQFFHRRNDVIRSDVVGLLERGARWRRRIRQTDPRDGGFEIVEGLARHRRRYFGGDSAGFPGGIGDYQPAGVANRMEDTFAIPGLDRAQIDYLRINSAAFQGGGGLCGMGAYVWGCDNGYIRARSADRRASDRHLVHF